MPAIAPAAGSANVRTMNSEAMVRSSAASCHGISPSTTIVIAM